VERVRYTLEQTVASQEVLVEVHPLLDCREEAHPLRSRVEVDSWPGCRVEVDPLQGCRLEAAFHLMVDIMVELLTPVFLHQWDQQDHSSPNICCKDICHLQMART